MITHIYTSGEKKPKEGGRRKNEEEERKFYQFTMVFKHYFSEWKSLFVFHKQDKKKQKKPQI